MRSQPELSLRALSESAATQLRGDILWTLPLHPCHLTPGEWGGHLCHALSLGSSSPEPPPPGPALLWCLRCQGGRGKRHLSLTRPLHSRGMAGLALLRSHSWGQLTCAPPHHAPLPDLLCCSDKVQGHLFQVLQSVRVRNSFPEFRSPGQLSHLLEVARGCRKDSIISAFMLPMAHEWQGQLSHTHVLGVGSPTRLPPGPALPSSVFSEKWGHLSRVPHS